MYIHIIILCFYCHTKCNQSYQHYAVPDAKWSIPFPRPQQTAQIALFSQLGPLVDAVDALILFPRSLIWLGCPRSGREIQSPKSPYTYKSLQVDTMNKNSNNNRLHRRLHGYNILQQLAFSLVRVALTTLLSNSEIYIPRNPLAPAQLPNLKYNLPKQKYKNLKKWEKFQLGQRTLNYPLDLYIQKQKEIRTELLKLFKICASRTCEFHIIRTMSYH